MTTPTTPTRAERRAQRLDDPRMERYRNPRSRRRLAGSLVGLLVAETAALAFIDVAPVPSVIALGVVTIAFVLCLGALKGSTRGVEELPAEVLDERQWQLRGEAYARSYRIGFGLLTAELVLVAVWLVAGWPSPGVGVVTAAVLLPFHVGVVLPTLVTATTREV